MWSALISLPDVRFPEVEIRFMPVPVVNPSTERSRPLFVVTASAVAEIAVPVPELEIFKTVPEAEAYDWVSERILEVSVQVPAVTMQLEERAATVPEIARVGAEPLIAFNETPAAIWFEEEAFVDHCILVVVAPALLLPPLIICVEPFG